MGKQKISLTPLEWEMMETIWSFKTKTTVREIKERAYPQGEKAYTTVQTVMNHLESKGILNKEKIGMVNFYTPVVKKSMLLKNEMSQLVNHSFGGSFIRLINYLIDSKALSRKEIDDLKRLLNEHDKET